MWCQFLNLKQAYSFPELRNSLTAYWYGRHRLFPFNMSSAEPAFSPTLIPIILSFSSILYLVLLYNLPHCQTTGLSKPLRPPSLSSWLLILPASDTQIYNSPSPPLPTSGPPILLTWITELPPGWSSFLSLHLCPEPWPH